METIRGKVAAIKDMYTIVINKGSDDGVEDGMHFVIYEPGEEIKDPDTNILLGNFEYVKAKVKVTYVSEKYAVAETYETYIAGGSSAYSALLSAAISLESRVQREKLPLPLSEDIKGTFSEKTKNITVNVGDSVKQILD